MSLILPAAKGHVQLISAFEKIAAEFPNARLFFAGRGMLAEVKEAAAKLPEARMFLPDGVTTLRRA